VRKSDELSGLKVANDILFCGSFGALALERSADQVSGAETHGQGKGEDDAAE
jgi:hypothetical protein